MFYETTLLLSPKLSTEELYSLWEKISQKIQSLGATIEKEVKPFERKLAYPIKNPRLGSENLSGFASKNLTLGQNLSAHLARSKNPRLGSENLSGFASKKGAAFNSAYLGIFYLAPQKARKELTRTLGELLKAEGAVIRFMVLCVSSIPEVRRRQAPANVAQETTLKESAKSPAHTTNEEAKGEKPSLEDLDKKLEEILEDKINF